MARDRTDADSGIDLLPEVPFLDDVAALLRCSPSTIKRPRWSQASFAQWLAVVGGSAGAGEREQGQWWSAQVGERTR